MTPIPERRPERPDFLPALSPIQPTTDTGGRPVRRLAGLFLLLAVAGGWASQEGPTAAELKRMYDDVVGQLKGAQTRKNELAAENEKLNARLAELEKRNKTLEVRAGVLEADSVDVADRTWQLRSTNAAWRAFVARDPALKSRWDRFLMGSPTPGDGKTDVKVDGRMDGPGFEISPVGPQSWLYRNWPLAGDL